MEELLTRDDFRNGVFKRDGHKCVVCGDPAKDAHHILERRLWKDGGYYLANGASVCEKHHLEAEATLLDCHELRRLCGIEKILLPEHLYSDQDYTKWGDPILPNGQRLKGELFHDESVQKIIKPTLHLYTNRVKPPRTYHAEWSMSISNDDRVMHDYSAFRNEEVVVSVKYDGENTSVYRDGFHARSIDTPWHPSRDWLWGIHRRMGYEIPEDWRVTGENVYAVHSIHYRNLPAHFLMFGIWNEKNICLSWDEMKEWSELLGLTTVEVLYRGPFDIEKIKSLYTPIYKGDECEGYVVRVARAFSYREYATAVFKNVRKGHVGTHGHWMRQAVEVNGLANGG